jgi:hypothetical protein
MAKSPKPIAVPLLPPPQPHQLSIVFGPILLQEITPADRARVLTHLASLLLLAAGVEPGEVEDGER